MPAAVSIGGPKQVLLFKATPQKGAKAGAIDLETTKRIISGRLSSAKLRTRCTVKPAGLNYLEVTTYGASEADLDKIKDYVTAPGSLEFAAVADPDENAELVKAAKEA